MKQNEIIRINKTIQDMKKETDEIDVDGFLLKAKKYSCEIINSSKDLDNDEKKKLIENSNKRFDDIKQKRDDWYRKMNSIQIIGYTEGDKDSGKQPIYFSIDTGMIKLNEEERKTLVETMVRDMWELHDNGDLYYRFSDEYPSDIKPTKFHVMNSLISNAILKNK